MSVCDELPPPQLLEGIRQFNRGEYFEQHERSSCSGGWSGATCVASIRGSCRSASPFTIYVTGITMERCLC